MPPKFGEVRKVLKANGFVCEREKKDQIWIRRNSNGGVEAKTATSHGNKQIRTDRLFNDILRQSKKTKEEFYRILKG